MKNIKFIPLFLIALSLIVSSCAIDDDDAVVGQTIITKTVSFVESEVIIAPSASPYNAQVMISEAFGTNMLIEYTLNGVDTGKSISGGTTMGGIPLDVSQEGLVYILTMTDITVANKPDNINAVIDQAKKTVKILVLDAANIPAVDPNALQVFMTWQNGVQNDLDLWITDDPVTVGFEISQTISPLEEVSFANTYADGTYNILARDWSSSDDPIGVIIVAVHPDGTVEYFGDSIANGSGFNYFVKFDKVGSTYTMTQVPAAPVF